MITLNSDEHKLLESGFKRLCELHRSRVAKDHTLSEFLTLEGKGGTILFQSSSEALLRLFGLIAMAAPDVRNHYNLKLSRRSLRLIEMYLKYQITTLSTQVLPEYDERIRKNPQQKQRLMSYVEEVKNRLTLTKELIKKVQKEL